MKNYFSVIRVERDLSSGERQEVRLRKKFKRLKYAQEFIRKHIYAKKVLNNKRLLGYMIVEGGAQ